MSAPKRKKGRSFMISFIWASAPGGGALAADGALISGSPLGFGVEVAGKASEEAAGTTSEDSGKGLVESGKEAGKEAASFSRGPFKETSSGSEPKPASISCGPGGEDGDLHLSHLEMDPFIQKRVRSKREPCLQESQEDGEEQLVKRLDKDCFVL